MIARERWARLLGIALVIVSMTACPGDDEDNGGGAEVEAPEADVEQSGDEGDGY